MSRSPARVLAPLALLACAVAILVIVSANRGGSGSAGSPSTSTTTTGQSTRTTTAARGVRHHRRSYVVKSGDVLSAIAEQNGVTLEELQRLNPTVDAHSLHAGQRLKLAP